MHTFIVRGPSTYQARVRCTSLGPSFVGPGYQTFISCEMKKKALFSDLSEEEQREESPVHLTF